MTKSCRGFRGKKTEAYLITSSKHDQYNFIFKDTHLLSLGVVSRIKEQNNLIEKTKIVLNKHDENQHTTMFVSGKLLERKTQLNGRKTLIFKNIERRKECGNN